MARKKNLRGTKIPARGRCEITANAAGNYVSVSDVKECAKVCSSHFFDRDTMRFFNSRIGEGAYYDGRGGAYFTTSEKGPDGRRGYSVRHYDPKRCGVDTVGKFQGYHSMAAAQTAAKRMATKGSALGRRRKRR
jgi:hypothetical protein